MNFQPAVTHRSARETRDASRHTGSFNFAEARRILPKKMAFEGTWNLEKLIRSCTKKSGFEVLTVDSLDDSFGLLETPLPQAKLTRTDSEFPTRKRVFAEDVVLLKTSQTVGPAG